MRDIAVWKSLCLACDDLGSMGSFALVLHCVSRLMFLSTFRVFRCCF